MGQESRNIRRKPSRAKVDAWAPAFAVIGLDEVGRGPLAGPVTAAGVVLRPGYSNEEITDSKQLTHEQRLRLAGEIVANSVASAVVCVGPRRIESLNIREASRLAMLLCVKRICGSLRSTNFQLLIDGNVPLATNLPQETIIKGDAKILCISAASILAKIRRDALMDDLERRFPGYNFAKNKGYPTKDHFTALQQLGPCRIHRRTYRGVSELVNGASETGASGGGDCRPLSGATRLQRAQT